MLVGYPPDRFRYSHGRGVWVLDDDFDTTSMLRVEDEPGSDTGSQVAVLRDAAGRALARGLLAADMPLHLARTGGGPNLRLDQIEIAGRLRLLVASEPLLPGHGYCEAVPAAPPQLRARAAQICALPALGAGTMVATDEGEQPVDWLRPGDRVLTRDNGYRPLIWIGQVEFVPGADTTTPFVVPVDAFGIEQPRRPLLATPSQCVLLAAPELHLWFGESEMFVRAAQLAQVFGVMPRPCIAPARLHLLLCAAPQVILTEGLWLGTAQATPAFLDLLPAVLRAQLEPVLAGPHRAAARASLAPWELTLLGRQAAGRKRLAA